MPNAQLLRLHLNVSPWVNINNTRSFLEMVSLYFWGRIIVLGQKCYLMRDLRPVGGLV